jgi:serine/threonine protein kinase
VIELLPGTLVAGTYRIDARLGRGAFGAVYRAEHRFIGRVALKLIEYGTSHDLERIASEGGRHARLNHPNVTRVFDVNTTELTDTQALYIASEYMALGDLDRYLDVKHRMPLSEVIQLAGDILAALSYAHSFSTPLLHRDLKPANVLIGGGPSLVFKVTDFV